jgi:hypothetical protein
MPGPGKGTGRLMENIRGMVTVKTFSTKPIALEKKRW